MLEYTFIDLYYFIFLGFNPSSVSTPIGQRASTSPVQVDHQTMMQFSHKHNGLYLFLSRTMRPVWCARVIHCVKAENKMQWVKNVQ